jgi:hypothetical protein
MKTANIGKTAPAKPPSSPAPNAPFTNKEQELRQQAHRLGLKYNRAKDQVLPVMFWGHPTFLRCSQGVRSSDRSSVSGKFFILGTEGSEFIVTDGKGVYKTGQQIITSKLTTEVGEAATTQVRSLTFNDQEALAPLLELQSAYPNAAIYLSGSVTVDFPEDVKLPIQPDQYQTWPLEVSCEYAYAMNLANLLPVGIASLTALALALPNLKAQSPTTTTSPAVAQSATAQQEAIASPRRLTVTVKVQEPQELKGQEGSQVKKGQNPDGSLSAEITLMIAREKR